jgi:hypothetical protein
MRRSAVLSNEPVPLYRYRLERDMGQGGKTAAVIMVNPSTADAEKDDHTIRKLLGFAQRLGIGRLIVGNKFALRATDVTELKAARDPIGPFNDAHLEQIMRDADLHIVAWGPLAKLAPTMRGRWKRIVDIARHHVGCPLYCFGTAQDGQPLHPLTPGYDRPLVLWTPLR